jgi:hypothetical protein
MRTVLSDPTTSPLMMAMHPSGRTRTVGGRRQRRRQNDWTQGASFGSGARSVYSTSPPPRKIARGRGGRATATRFVEALVRHDDATVVLPS